MILTALTLGLGLPAFFGMEGVKSFLNAAAPLSGMGIKVVSKTTATQEYEPKVLHKTLPGSPAPMRPLIGSTPTYHRL